MRPATPGPLPGEPGREHRSQLLVQYAFGLVVLAGGAVVLVTALM